MRIRYFFRLWLSKIRWDETSNANVKTTSKLILGPRIIPGKGLGLRFELEVRCVRMNGGETCRSDRPLSVTGFVVLRLRNAPLGDCGRNVFTKECGDT